VQPQAILSGLTVSCGILHLSQHSPNTRHPLCKSCDRQYSRRADSLPISFTASPFNRIANRISLYHAGIGGEVAVCIPLHIFRFFGQRGPRPAAEPTRLVLGFVVLVAMGADHFALGLTRRNKPQRAQTRWDNIPCPLWASFIRNRRQ
jgi:hypothetical protein